MSASTVFPTVENIAQVYTRVSLSNCCSSANFAIRQKVHFKHPNYLSEDLQRAQDDAVRITFPSPKPGFHITVSGVRIVSVVPCCRQAIAGNSGDSYVVQFPYNHICHNSARRDWVLQRATPCFDDKERHCGIPLQRSSACVSLKFGCCKAVISDRLGRKDRTWFHRDDRVASDVLKDRLKLSLSGLTRTTHALSNSRVSFLTSELLPFAHVWLFDRWRGALPWWACVSAQVKMAPTLLILILLFHTLSCRFNSYKSATSNLVNTVGLLLAILSNTLTLNFILYVPVVLLNLYPNNIINHIPVSVMF